MPLEALYAHLLTSWEQSRAQRAPACIQLHGLCIVLRGTTETAALSLSLSLASCRIISIGTDDLYGLS